MDDFAACIPSHFSSVASSGIEAALKAGCLLKKGFGTVYQIKPKTMKNDLVTEYDHASEQLILSFLKERFPSFSFLCEESGHTPIPDAEYCWVIDPLDGTVNFAHNFPLFCVSIALCKGDDVLCGAIYQPITDELFVVEKDKGAYLNGIPLKVSETAILDNAFVSTSLSFNLHRNPADSIARFGQIAHQGFPLRAIGSTALNLAYIAAGRLDAYWSVGGSINAWDVAAGKLMIQEAGGSVTQCNGTPYLLHDESTILATNGTLHNELKNALKGSL